MNRYFRRCLKFTIFFASNSEWRVKSEYSKLNLFINWRFSIVYGSEGKSFLILSEGRRFPAIEGLGN